MNVCASLRRLRLRFTAEHQHLLTAFFQLLRLCGSYNDQPCRLRLSLLARAIIQPQTPNTRYPHHRAIQLPPSPFTPNRARRPREGSFS